MITQQKLTSSSRTDYSPTESVRFRIQHEDVCKNISQRLVSLSFNQLQEQVKERFEQEDKHIEFKMKTEDFQINDQDSLEDAINKQKMLQSINTSISSSLLRSSSGQTAFILPLQVSFSEPKPKISERVVHLVLERLKAVRMITVKDVQTIVQDAKLESEKYNQNYMLLCQKTLEDCIDLQAPTLHSSEDIFPELSLGQSTNHTYTKPALNQSYQPQIINKILSATKPNLSSSQIQQEDRAKRRQQQLKGLKEFCEDIKSKSSVSSPDQSKQPTSIIVSPSDILEQSEEELPELVLQPSKSYSLDKDQSDQNKLNLNPVSEANSSLEGSKRTSSNQPSSNESPPNLAQQQSEPFRDQNQNKTLEDVPLNVTLDYNTDSSFSIINQSQLNESQLIDQQSDFDKSNINININILDELKPTDIYQRK